MPEYLYPGVYIEETQSGNKPIEGVSTSTVGFLGVAERGPETTTLITSYSEFVRSFGHYFTDAAGNQRYLAFGLEGFYQNGGKRCFVQRVWRDGGAPAVNGDPNVRITAIGQGTWGNRVGIKVAPNADNTAFTLTVMYWSEAPPAPIVDPTSRDPQDLRDPNRREPQLTEVFEDLSTNEKSSSFYERQINDVSTLIKIEQVLPDMPAAVAAPELLAGGADGAGDLVPADFKGDPADEPGTKTGLDALNEVDEISLLTSPDEHAIANFEIAKALIDQCELRKDRFAILSSLDAAGPIATHIIDYNSKYAAYYYP